MNLELFPDNVQRENTLKEVTVDEVRQRGIENLGLDEADLLSLTIEAKRVAGIVGGVPDNKRAKKKFSNALWSLMQQRPDFAMDGPDQLIVFRAILARELPPEPKTASPRKKETILAPPSSLADLADPSLQRKAYVDKSIEAANGPNPY